jgi:DNA-binding LacI/PurR family transcriptional regulator
VSVFLCNVGEDRRLGQLHVDALLEKRVDGILATGKRLDRHLPIDLSDLGVPVIYTHSPSRTRTRSLSSRTMPAAPGSPSST